MNDQTTHQDWHPQDSPEYLTAAIDRVREDYMMQDERDGAFVWEWYFGNRPSTPAEEIGVYRRERRRSTDLVAYHAEPALPERPAPRRELPPRICAGPGCGLTFFPSRPNQVYHDSACGHRAARKRYKQRQGAA